MGKVLSLMGRPLKNYNIESRAHKIISQEKPVPAPKYKSDQLIYEKMMQDYPEAYNEEQIKHKQLDNHLKEVYVKSHDIAPQQQARFNPERPLPLNRNQVDDFEFGVKEPEKVPEGKITLKKALRFITDHQSNPRLHNSEKISQDYAVPEETIKNILKYCKVYEVYIPEQRKVKAKFAGPSVPRIKMTVERRKELMAGKLEKDNT